jgi:hypothetical protein
MEQHGNRCVWRRKRQRLSPGMCHRYRNAVLVGGRELPVGEQPARLVLTSGRAGSMKLRRTLRQLSARRRAARGLPKG